MKNIVLLFLICLIQCKPKTIQQFNEACCISLEFDGYSNAYFNKHDLFLEIKSNNKNKFILAQLNDFKEIGYLNTRLVLWKIKAYDPKGERIFDLLELESGEYVFKKNGDLFKNDILYNYLINKLQVKKIGAFPGPVNQDIYNDLIK